MTQFPGLSMDPDTGLINDAHLVGKPLPADTLARCLSIEQCGKPLFDRIQSKWHLPDDTMRRIVYYLEPKVMTDNVLKIAVSAVGPLYVNRLRSW